MELTFVTDLGQSFVVEIDPNMELEDVMALLEAEVRSLSFFVSTRSLVPRFHASSPAFQLASKVFPMRGATSAIPRQLCASVA